MKVIWCMVAEISSMADRTFWLFGLFCPILPPNNPKSQNFEKMKKIPGDISILHKCTINDNYMIYGFWDMKCNRYVFLSFGPFFFLPFNESLKNENFKTDEKNTWRHHYFTQVYQKSWSYVILFLRYGPWQM